MSNRENMRPRKGDLYVKIGDAEGSMTMLLEREKITPRHIEVMARLKAVAIELLGSPLLSQD